ncbi:MAG: hypothetical protein RLZZ11_2095, partial [Cyanobacteriota bacterium]
MDLPVTSNQLIATRYRLERSLAGGSAESLWLASDQLAGETPVV